jgi:hypothetical protein
MAHQICSLKTYYSDFGLQISFFGYDDISVSDNEFSLLNLRTWYE